MDIIQILEHQLLMYLTRNRHSALMKLVTTMDCRHDFGFDEAH